VRGKIAVGEGVDEALEGGFKSGQALCDFLAVGVKIHGLFIHTPYGRVESWALEADFGLGRGLGVKREMSVRSMYNAVLQAQSSQYGWEIVRAAHFQEARGVLTLNRIGSMESQYETGTSDDRDFSAACGVRHR
jgi:hypothetical protein